MTADEEIAHESNAYFAALDGIATELDAIAKVITPDAGDDGAPPDGMEKPSSNSYFASFRNISDALARLNTAVAERIGGGSTVPPAYEHFEPEMGEFERLALRNRAVNRIALNEQSPYVVLPPAIDGKARDFIVRLEQRGTARLVMPLDVSYESDDAGVFDTVEAGETALYFFFETKSGVFLVSRKNVETLEL